jgi:hypothetical protein
MTDSLAIYLNKAEESLQGAEASSPKAATTLRRTAVIRRASRLLWLPCTMLALHRVAAGVNGGMH